MSATFALPAVEEVELAVYNMAGQKVVTLVQGVRTAGAYAVRWDGLDGQGQALASGVYVYRLRAGSREQTQKLLLLK
jgi:flagellar hook assembly protein FlgD